MSASAITFSELFPELFPIISAHLPLAYRPSTLLSLALTCHRLQEIIVPRLLYNDVRLVGEDQALPILNTLIAKAQHVNEEDIQKKGNPSPSHCIHRLCIDSSIEAPISTRLPGSSINALQKLIDVDGLRHLSDLNLHIKVEWLWDDGDDGDPYDAKLPSSFFISLRTKCPHLKSVYMTGFNQEFGNEWIEPELLSFESLTSIRVDGYLNNYPTPTIKFSQLPPNLHTLELQLSYFQPIDLSGPGGLFKSVIPNLNTLILDDCKVSDPASATTFWRAHPGIERLEFGRNTVEYKTTGSWFDNFEVGMLPNLKYLMCEILPALDLLPHVSKSLIRLSLRNTYNAQGPYLLRALVPGGILPALRSLGIHRESGNSPKPREGHRWREDENGGVSQADAKKPSRQFDGNYIMSISKAAPNLEELELMGSSDDTLDSITASLSRFPKLQRLTLSGGLTGRNGPFFARSYIWADYDTFHTANLPETCYGKYAPENFDEAARDLANGCRTLDVITFSNILGELVIRPGPSARIVREREGGVVKEVKRIRAWGNIIGKEEEW